MMANNKMDEWIVVNDYESKVHQVPFIYDNRFGMSGIVTPEEKVEMKKLPPVPKPLPSIPITSLVSRRVKMLAAKISK